MINEDPFEKPESTSDPLAGLPQDPASLIMAVIRESYAEQAEDLRYHAQKIKQFNQQKKELRAYLSELRKASAAVKMSAAGERIDRYTLSKEGAERIAGLIKERAYEIEKTEIRMELGLPDRVPPEDTFSIDELEAQIKKWEEALNTIGEDAQLANIDLQNALQRQQQTLQLMSNVSKMVHDTSMAILRKIG